MGSSTTKSGVKSINSTPYDCFKSPKISRVLYLLELFPNGLSRPDLESLLNTGGKNDKGIKEAIEALQHYLLIKSKYERTHQQVRAKYTYNKKAGKEEFVAIEKGFSGGRPATVYYIKKYPLVYLFGEVLPSSNSGIKKENLRNLKSNIERRHLMEKFLTAPYSELKDLQKYWWFRPPGLIPLFQSPDELSKNNAVLTQLKEKALKSTLESLSEKSTSYAEMLSGYAQVELLSEVIRIIERGGTALSRSAYDTLVAFIEMLAGRNIYLVREMRRLIEKSILEEEELKRRERYDIQGELDIRAATEQLESATETNSFKATAKQKQ